VSGLVNCQKIGGCEMLKLDFEHMHCMKVW